MLNVAIGNFSQYLLLQYCVSGQAHKAYLLEENFKKKKKKKKAPCAITFQQYILEFMEWVFPYLLPFILEDTVSTYIHVLSSHTI